MIQNNMEELLHIYKETLFQAPDVEISFDEKSSLKPIKNLILLNEEIGNVEVELMLSKMLKACNLDLVDYKSIVISPTYIIEQINYHQPDRILLFGLTLENETFASLKEKYQPFRFAGKSFLMADSLSAIHANPGLKAILWNKGLKPLYNIA